MKINYPERDHKFFICQCESPEHVLHFVHDQDYDELYVYVHLTKDRFFKRLWNAIKYVFGHQCKYGAFDEFIFNRTSTDVMLKYFKKMHKTPKQYDNHIPNETTIAAMEEARSKDFNRIDDLVEDLHL